MGGLSGKDFNVDKIAQYSKQRKEIPKQHESISPVQTPANPRADLLIQERKEFGGKIKLENKLTDRVYNYLLKVNIKNTRKICKTCSKLT